MFILFADPDPETHRYDCARSCGFAYHQPDALLPVRVSVRWCGSSTASANVIFRIFKLPMVRKDDITSDDIYAVGSSRCAGRVLRKQEHELIENVSSSWNPVPCPLP